MTGYLDSDAPLANGSHWLSDWRSSVRTAANKEELIAEYAATGLPPAPPGHTSRP